jgi:hypothetical protein
MASLHVSVAYAPEVYIQHYNVMKYCVSAPVILASQSVYRQADTSI